MVCSWWLIHVFIYLFSQLFIYLSNLFVYLIYIYKYTKGRFWWEGWPYIFLYLLGYITISWYKPLITGCCLGCTSMRGLQICWWFFWHYEPHHGIGMLLGDTNQHVRSNIWIGTQPKWGQKTCAKKNQSMGICPEIESAGCFGCKNLQK